MIHQRQPGKEGASSVSGEFLVTKASGISWIMNYLKRDDTEMCLSNTTYTKIPS